MRTFLSASVLVIALGAHAQPYDLHAIDSLLEATHSTLYAGNVVCMIAKDDSLIYYNAYGTYDSTSQALVASVSKTFSATLLLSLAGDDLLDLDDTLGQYLPLATAHGTGHCTLRQCFSHTAGWPEDDTPYTYLSNPFYTLQHCADSLVTHLSYQYAPGTAFDYGGVSMQLAGAAAETAGGDRWNTLFDARIRTPLGLQESVYAGAGPLNPNIAGGMRSSPRDLMKLGALILHNGVYGGHTVVPAPLMDNFWMDQTNAAPVIYSPFPAHPPYDPYGADTVRYGLGCWLDIQRPDDGFVEAMSADGAFGTSLFVDRCRGLVGVVFTLSSVTETIAPNLFIEHVVRGAVPGDCLSTAIAEGAPHVAALVVPNPASTEATVQCPSGTVALRVCDAAGRSVLQLPVTGPSATVDVLPLRAGYYFVEFVGADRERGRPTRLLVTH